MLSIVADHELLQRTMADKFGHRHAHETGADVYVLAENHMNIYVGNTGNTGIANNTGNTAGCRLCQRFCYNDNKDIKDIKENYNGGGGGIVTDPNQYEISNNNYRINSNGNSNCKSNGNGNGNENENENIGGNISGNRVIAALYRLGPTGSRVYLVFAIIVRLVAPLTTGLVRSLDGMRDASLLRTLRSIANSRRSLINLLAFGINTISIGLSSVHVPHRLELFLRLIKVRRRHSGVVLDAAHLVDNIDGGQRLLSSSSSPSSSTPSSSSSSPSSPSSPSPSPPKCCTLNILAQPPAGTPIRADIIFIHGLHGSLANTWRQGRWQSDCRPVAFERPLRPPRPPLRPPKRLPNCHSNPSIRSPQQARKRARFMQIETAAELTAAAAAEAAAEATAAPSMTFSLRSSQSSFALDAGVDSDDVRFRLHNDGQHLLLPANNQQRALALTRAPIDVATEGDVVYSKCWPGDWLPCDCPGVRVIAVNYTTDSYLWRPLWKKKEPRTNLVQRSREMAELLAAEHVGSGHPIVWVGHSKGGLFVKQIIVEAWESRRPAVSPLWRSTRGVFFYSVPHRGSHLASLKAPLLIRSVELVDIEKDNKYLIDLHRRFVSLYQLGHLNIDVFTFVETALTLMSVLYLRIVGVDSADPGIGNVCGVRLDHREICKPRSRDCLLYKELVNMINNVLRP